MTCKRGVLLFCVLTIVWFQDVLADTEDKSEEVEADKEVKYLTYNESSSAEVGPPDSHEAMNNRETNLNMRNKRSYEFLMGLIRNNSKYEVTKPDPSPKNFGFSQEDDPSASEILLELMVKIAAHPDHWHKVHNLLENIDNDLLASKRIVENLQNAKIGQSEEVDGKAGQTIAFTKKESGPRKNKTDSRFLRNEWPTFQESSEISNKVTFTVSPESYSLQDDQHRTNYPKTFAYHRVTGRPMFLNKNPKAYIAVSVIAPKPMSSRSKDEDLILEKELRQLKPWTHNQNLQNMASIRSRWIIQRDDNEKQAIAP